MKGSASIFCLLMFLFGVPHAIAERPTVRGIGAVAVALPLSEAGNVLRTERNIQVLLRVGASGSALDALGEHFVDFALCNREVEASDQAAFPQVVFTEIPIGVQLLAIAVSRDVWDGGVRSLSAGQLRGIYEGRIKNWKEVGGADQKIRLFMNEPGRGQWEMFVQWLYGEIKRAPVWKGDSVKEAQETRNVLEFTPGSFSLVPPSFANNRSIFNVAIHGESGELLEPTLANVLNKKYPLSRPLLLVTDDRPTGPLKVVVDFMVGERGQALVKRFGYVTLEELKTAKAVQ